MSGHLWFWGICQQMRSCYLILLKSLRRLSVSPLMTHHGVLDLPEVCCHLTILDPKQTRTTSLRGSRQMARRSVRTLAKLQWGRGVVAYGDWEKHSLSGQRTTDLKSPENEAYIHWHGVRSHFISWTIQNLSQSAPTNNSSTLDLLRAWYACNLGAKYSSWARVKKRRKKTAPKKIRVLTTKFSALWTCRASHRLAPYASAATSRSGRPSAWRSRHSANGIWWPRGISLFQFDVRLWAGDLIAILATEW